MTLLDIMDQNVKKDEKKYMIVDGIKNNEISIDDIKDNKDKFLDKDFIVIFEALFNISKHRPELSNSHWLSFLKHYLLSSNNSIKKEVLLIIGNIASLYPNNLDDVLKKVLKCEASTKELQLVKYDTLTKIVKLDKYKDSEYALEVKKIGEDLVANSSGILNF